MPEKLIPMAYHRQLNTVLAVPAALESPTGLVTGSGSEVAVSHCYTHDQIEQIADHILQHAVSLPETGMELASVS